MSPHPARGPTARHLTVGLVLTAAVAVALWYSLSRARALAPWLLAWFAAITVVTFCYYGWDKRRARLGARRVPETALHTLALLGGSLGAYGGMRWFRHKTLKGRFRILFWLIVAVQVALLAFVIKVTWFGGTAG